jgi:TonB family protein
MSRRPPRLWSLLLTAVLACSAGLATAPADAVAQAPADVVPPKLVKAVEPVYPKSLEDKGLRAAVVVELDLDTAGKVKKATIVESAGPEFDDAALEAAKQLEFTPATVGGKPSPVRIRYRFDFAPPFRADRRASAVSQGRYDRRDLERAPAGFSSVDGIVLERGTNRPVSGALVTIPSQGAEVVTDGDGRFRFGLLRPGVAEVYMPGAEHKPLRVKATIVEGKTVSLRLKPERLSYTVYRSTAEGPPEAGEVARRSLGVQEIQRIPGNNGDAFKVVQSLPGVARGTAGSGLLIVRGSAPNDTQINVEGVRIPLLYHFGGIYSIINTDVLETIDFYPGGYPVRYGRQTGGVITAKLAVPKEGEPWSGYIESNIFHTGFLLKGPLGKNSNITLAARRSYVDAILSLPPLAKLLPLTLAPRYYDYQAKFDHRFSKKTDLTVFLFGTDDAVAAVLTEAPRAFPQARGGLEARTSFGTLLGVLRHRDDLWSSTTTIGATIGLINASFGDLFRFDLTNREYTFRQDFLIGKGAVQLRPGLDIFCNPYLIEVYAPPLANTGERGTGSGPPLTSRRVQVEQGGIFVSPAAHFDAIIQVSPDLQVVPGLRFDLFRGDSGGEALTPRLNARYNLNDSVVLKGSTGMNVQRPQPQEVAPNFGNPSLLPFRSYETSAGVEWKLDEALSVDLQGFEKELRGVVVYPTGVVSEKPQNSGIGRIYGMELLVRHKPIGQFFGWIAYTLQKAQRKDGPDEPWRLFGWDQTHIFTALGSYKLPNNWEVGARFRLVTGNPITPVVTAVWNEQTDTYTRVNSSEPNSARLPTFHQLDIRVDKKFVFDNWLLNLYLDVQNVYNRGNPENIQYNFDATANTYATGLPIIPSFGVRAEF